MAVNALSTAFRRITIGGRRQAFMRCHSTQEKVYDIQRSTTTFLFLQSHNTKDEKTNMDGYITFTPRTINIDFELPVNHRIYNNVIEIPFIKIPSLEEPKRKLPTQIDVPLSSETMELPATENVVEKFAHKMIRIRKKKMKKHQRKKLRKRMKFVWRKIKQKRELDREKGFQAEQVAFIKHAEKFDAANYVMEKLNDLNKERLPKIYRGEVLPAEMIKQFLKEKEEKKLAKRNKPRLTL